MTTEVAPEMLAQMKRMTRTTWALGNFPEVARRSLWNVGDELVRRVGVGVGEDVLDVACGTGNVALRAARAGGRVTGVDITPELFEAGRLLADDAGVSVEWVEGDAEDLPFEDASFDLVLSTFGVMFAPRHQVAADELVRVLRPGGRLGICSWTPEGAQGESFRILGAHLPPPPPFAQPPLLWGTETHVTELFAGSGVTLEFERATAVEPERFASGYEAADWSAENFGPLIMAKPMLEAKGVWPQLREEFARMYDGNLPPEYLMVLGRKNEEAR